MAYSHICGGGGCYNNVVCIIIDDLCMMVALLMMCTRLGYITTLMHLCLNFVDVGAVVHRGQCVVVFDDACWCAFCFNMQSISTIDSCDATLLQPVLLSLIQRH